MMILIIITLASIYQFTIEAMLTSPPPPRNRMNVGNNTLKLANSGRPWSVPFPRSKHRGLDLQRKDESADEDYEKGGRSSTTASSEHEQDIPNNQEGDLKDNDNDIIPSAHEKYQHDRVENKDVIRTCFTEKILIQSDINEDGKSTVSQEFLQENSKATAADKSPDSH